MADMTTNRMENQLKPRGDECSMVQSSKAHHAVAAPRRAREAAAYL
jgi:hypothetical protein